MRLPHRLRHLDIYPVEVSGGRAGQHDDLPKERADSATTRAPPCASAWTTQRRRSLLGSRTWIRCNSSWMQPAGDIHSLYELFLRDPQRPAGALRRRRGPRKGAGVRPSSAGSLRAAGETSVRSASTRITGCSPTRPSPSSAIGSSRSTSPSRTNSSSSSSAACSKRRAQCDGYEPRRSCSCSGETPAQVEVRVEPENLQARLHAGGEPIPAHRGPDPPHPQYGGVPGPARTPGRSSAFEVHSRGEGHQRDPRHRRRRCEYQPFYGIRHGAGEDASPAPIGAPSGAGPPCARATRGARSSSVS